MQEERKSIEQCDDEADKKIAYMIAGMVGCAVVPAAMTSMELIRIVNAENITFSRVDGIATSNSSISIFPW